LNTPKKNAAPQASRRSASRSALTERLGRVRVIAVADTTTGMKNRAGSAGSGSRAHDIDCYREQTCRPMTASHQPSPSRRVLRKAGRGHEDQFAPPGLSGRHRFSEPTSTGTNGNERDAP
jgi:hypothetical protein